MTLNDLIERLKQAPPEKVCAHGFDDYFSWRGAYDEIAFRPALNVSVQAMLNVCEEAKTGTLFSYKGGEFAVCPDRTVHLAESYGAYRGEDDAFPMRLLEAWLA